jgi:hypothetical protein
MRYALEAGKRIAAPLFKGNDRWISKPEPDRRPQNRGPIRACGPPEQTRSANDHLRCRVRVFRRVALGIGAGARRLADTQGGRGNWGRLGPNNWSRAGSNRRFGHFTGNPVYQREPRLTKPEPAV